MWVKLTAEQKADIINQYKSWDKEGALATAKSINSGTTLNSMSTSVATNNSRNSQVWTGSVAPMNTPTTTTKQNTTKQEQNMTPITEMVGGMSTPNWPTKWTLPTTKSSNQYDMVWGMSTVNWPTKWTLPTSTTGYMSTVNWTAKWYTTSDLNAIANQWNGLSYEQQQAKLKQYPTLKNYLATKWITEKKPQSTPVAKTSSPAQTKPEWDYQDNSQARMDEIADNLDKYRQTNPYLFDDYSMFYNFFIDWKWRSQDQINFLNDYFNRIQDTNKYNNLTPWEVGNWLVNGTIPDSYLSDIQNIDPERAAAIKDEKKKAEDVIKNNSFLESAMKEVWYEDTDFWTWNKKEMLYRDEDNDWIDDRNYHAPTEEERAKVDRNFEIEAELLDIDNTIKRTYDDYREKYPWATKAELMAMAQDTNNDLLKKKDDLLVEQTKLQWTIKYLQAERQEMDKAGQLTIQNIQDDYGIYLKSPEGLKAQYAATNVTLEQADNGSDTDKQLALDRVLSDYYAKYGDIIQRPMSQVINDVMEYAKEKWISLSQALQENFVKPLQSKPEYAQLSKLTSSPDVVRIGTDANGNPIYWTYNSTTWKFEAIDLSGYGIGGNYGGNYWGNYGGGYYPTWWEGVTPWGVKYTTVSEEGKINWLSDFLWDLSVWDYGGECWAFVNDYLQSIWAWRIYDNDLSTKLKSINSDTPEIWSVAVFDYSNAPANSSISDKARKHGHVWVVVWYNADAGTVTIVESNKDWDKLISAPREIPLSNLYLKWYFNPSQWYTESGKAVNNFGGKFANDSDWNSNGYFNSLVPYFKTAVNKWKIDLTDAKYKDVLADYWITSKEFNEMATNYANTELKSGWWQQAANALEIATKLYNLIWDNSNVPWRTVLQALRWTNNSKAKDEYNSLMKRLSLKELFAAKELWATFGAMSDSEWNLLENAATDLNWYSGNFTENLEYLIESLYDAALDWKWTLPRNFAGSSAEQMLKTRKAEWSWIGGSKFQNNWQTNDIYSDLYD